MQYKVPQNIDIEDKVIAGLTLRQFMFIMIAGGVMLLEFYAFAGALGFLFLPTVLVTAGVGIAFAFVKINDRPFEIFVVSAAKSLLAPRSRVWQKDWESSVPKHIETIQTRETVRPKKGVKEIRSSLERLATVVDSGGAAGTDSSNERKTNVVSTSKPEPQNVEDILAKTERGSASVDQYLDQAKEFVDKNRKEPTIGAIATVKTKKEDFEYEKLELANEKHLDEVLEKVEEKQKDLDQRMSKAKIERF